MFLARFELNQSIENPFSSHFKLKATDEKSFSNSLIIQQVITKEIITVTVVLKSDLK